MDGFQLPQGYSHFEQAIYFLPLNSQKFLILAWLQVAWNSSDQDGEAEFTKSKKHYLLQFILIKFMK